VILGLVSTSITLGGKGYRRKHKRESIIIMFRGTLYEGVVKCNGVDA
jgi:hypothetical protein